MTVRDCIGIGTLLKVVNSCPEQRSYFPPVLLHATESSIHGVKLRILTYAGAAKITPPQGRLQIARIVVVEG